MKIANLLSIILWFIASLYFGVGGLYRLHVEADIEKLQDRVVELKRDTAPNEIYRDPSGINIKFNNMYDYLTVPKTDQYRRYFSVLADLPSFLGLIITSISFGIIGAFCKDIWGEGNRPPALTYGYILRLPILGMFIGVAILGISYVIPNVLIVGSNSIRPESLMFLSLFAGFNYQKFLGKLSNILSNVLSSQ